MAEQFWPQLKEKPAFVCVPFTVAVNRDILFLDWPNADTLFTTKQTLEHIRWPHKKWCVSKMRFQNHYHRQADESAKRRPTSHLHILRCYLPRSDTMTLANVKCIYAGSGSLTDRRTDTFPMDVITLGAYRWIGRAPAPSVGSK